VAVGIVIGATLASKFVTLEKADRALPAGVLIGLAVCVLAVTTREPTAFVVMTFVGASGGFFVVPLNALVQEQGHRTVGSGNAIAIQNLAENATMLIMIGLYTVAARAGTPRWRRRYRLCGCTECDRAALPPRRDPRCATRPAVPDVTSGGQSTARERAARSFR
jgi:hypothetical protein